MKVAVASEGSTEDSKVCEVSGRAPYYLFFDDGKLVETMKNPFTVGGGGAGFAVAKTLENKHVNLVIAGKFGGNMLSALDEKGIRHKEVQGKNVRESLDS